MNDLEMLQLIQEIMFGLNNENIKQSLSSMINLFNTEYSYSFNLNITQIVCTSFDIKFSKFDPYFELMKGIEAFEETNKIEFKIIDIFLNKLLDKTTQKSCHLIEAMINLNLIDSNVIDKLVEPYFIHRMGEEKIRKNEEFLKQNILNYEMVSKNDFELHKKYVKEEQNPNEIEKIIRNDEMEKLQEISSQTNFDFSQKIEKSLYERYEFINEWNVTLIDYAAFFGSIKCFKYLLMNNANVYNTGKYAIAGGNLEIIHLCEQNYSSFEESYETAIEFHKNEIFHYLYDKKIEELNLKRLGKKCILYHNYEILSFLIKEGLKINNDIINKSAKIGNLFLIKHFLNGSQLPKDILVYSSGSGNIELVKYLLKQKVIDINAKNIRLSYLKYILMILYFKIKFGNSLNYLIQH